jgi:hypothetical protein
MERHPEAFSFYLNLLFIKTKDWMKRFETYEDFNCGQQKVGLDHKYTGWDEDKEKIFGKFIAGIWDGSIKP